MVVKEFVQELMKTATDTESCKKAAKLIDQQENYKQVASKLLKLMYKVQEENSLNKEQSELNYIAEFMAPLRRKIFYNSVGLNFEWADRPLDATREEYHSAQKDNERRAPGRKPDGIFALQDLGLEFALVEVSGPPNDGSHQHYVGDRNKIAKQLKHALKKIRKAVRGGDPESY